MRFVSDGPDVPDKLVESHEDGDVVFFCGAGISYPAGLSGFKGLVDDIYRDLGENKSTAESIAYKQERFDVVVDLVERRLADRLRVRRAIASALQPDLTLRGATDTHRALLTLSRTRDDRIRLLTTNFDRIFATLEPAAGYFNAPLLPVPKRSRWNGLIYLHGLLPERDDADALERLVVSSGDFGLAYLTERWASRFVTELFRYYTICFVGYSINDPVLRYMMDALSADRMRGETATDVYAFGSYKNGKQRAAQEEWRAKGVVPVLYKERRGAQSHAHLHRTLAEWAGIYRDGLLGKQAIVKREGQARPSPVVGDGQISRVLWALCDPTGVPARVFAEMDPLPPIEWLSVFEENRFALADLPRFGIDPRPDDAIIEFSVACRPTPYRFASWMTLSCGSMRAQPDEVMSQLARWLARHLDKRETLAWVLKHGSSLNSIFIALVDDQLAAGALPAHIAVVWRMFVTRRIEVREERYEFYDWEQRVRRNGWSSSLKYQFLELLEPRVRFSDSRVHIEEINEGGNLRARDFAPWEIVLRANAVQAHLGGLAGVEGWTSVLVDLLPGLTEQLRTAFDLMRELGSVDVQHDFSYVHQPSISEHPQNRGFAEWTALIELCRDGFLVAVELDIDQAKLTAARWQEICYPVFRRLSFFAATYPSVIPTPEGLSLLLADNAWWLWSVETEREALRLLTSLAPRLRQPNVDSLLTAVLTGPPRTMFRDEVEPEQLARVLDREIWLRLEKYAAAGGALDARAEGRLAELRLQYPIWQLQPGDQDEFPVWMGDDDSLRKKVVLPRELPQLVASLTERSGEDFWSEDDWVELCRTETQLAVSAMRELARRNVWPTEVWRRALQVFAEEQFVQEYWLSIATLLRGMPEEAMPDLRHAVAWWLRAGAKRVPNVDQFFALAHKILDSCTAEEMRLDNDPVFQAINHPIGLVTEAALNWWYTTKPTDGVGLPPEVSRLLTRVADPATGIFRHGRVVLGAHAIALFRVDPAWSSTSLLPRFDWRDEEEARAVWEGFLWMPRLHRGLFSAFRASFLECASRYAHLGQHGEQYADLLTLAALEISDVFGERDLRRAFSELPPEGLSAAANMLVRALNDVGEKKEDYWLNRVRPFIQRIWPKSAQHRTSDTSVALARVCIAAGTHFVEALDLIVGLLIPSTNLYLVARDLDRSGLCVTEAAQALRLLDAIVDDSDRIPPEALASCLRKIRDQTPALAETGAFRRLLTYLTRFNRNV